jgi:transposase
MLDYKYYIGLDAHKRNCYFVVLNRKGKILTRKKVPTEEAELVRFVAKYKGPKALVFEETGLAQWLCITFKDKVDHLEVCQATKKMAKSDFRDALEMAELLMANKIKSVFHGETKYVFLRDLVTGYDNLVKNTTQAKNRLSHLFSRTAIRKKGLGIYTNQDAIRLLPGFHRQFVANGLFQQMQMLDQQKRGYLEKFRGNLDPFPEMKLIMGIPGFGIVRTNQVVAHIITPYRFATKYRLFSYAMLVRHQQTSDGKTYGVKSGFAKIQLKEIFKSAALTALMSDNAFRRKYARMLTSGKNERSARSAIAKSLAATVLGVWKSGKPYDDNYRENNRDKNVADDT